MLSYKNFGKQQSCLKIEIVFMLGSTVLMLCIKKSEKGSYSKWKHIKWMEGEIAVHFARYLAKWMQGS